MKKQSIREREITVSLSLSHRCGKQTRKLIRTRVRQSNVAVITPWLKFYEENGINIERNSKRGLILSLPERMNFYDDYENSALCIKAIRQLASIKPKTKKCFKLRRVDFSKLRSISSSAALVLTAELAKWDDTLYHRLMPEVGNWSPQILKYFNDLGYFDLFSDKPDLDRKIENPRLKIAKYIKGKCGDSRKIRELKRAVNELVGDQIDKWPFLRAGLDEAITNVSHHAYPAELQISEDKRSWYVTGAYDTETKELKISFYDQGVGIPNTLPKTTFGEYVISMLDGLKVTDRLDATLIKAAMQISRSRTGEDERGKGLRDMLEFIKQRGEGYLSIISLKGLYKHTISGSQEHQKSINFNTALPGTLIIWNVKLSD